MWVKAYFEESGSPKTGLSPTVTIYDMTDDSVVVNAAPMPEVAAGFYKYDFSAVDRTKEYTVIADSVTLSGNEQYAVTDIDKSDFETEIEAGYSAKEILRLITATTVNKVSGAQDEIQKFRDVADTKDRVVARVDKKDNRLNITRDVT
ncbi:hypothetical protein KAR91_83480 [Candidatus Pacearchaeota archaeon]|nr:hypothetical protein [Candidatus Pacearchaeota archaeon]